MKKPKGLIFLVVLILLFSLTACAKSNSGKKTVTLVIGEGDGQKVFASYKTDAEYLIDLLNELEEKGEITFSATDSALGAYLTEINGITSGDGKYIMVLTTLEEYWDTTDWKIVKTYGGTEYVSAIVGISALKISDGAGYMIALA